ncbi:signal peptidase I [Candidatus Dependentiae bacterium]
MNYLKKGNPVNNTNRGGFLKDVKEIAILLVIVFLIRTFGFGLYQVPTGSMETTMLVGERFFADKFTILFSDIKRSDIIAFNDPLFNYSKNKLTRLFQEYAWGPVNWTKRTIGVPGDEVKGVIENGKPEIYINGKKLYEPYLNKYPLIQVWKKSLVDIRKMLQKNPSINLGQFLALKSYDPNIPFGKTQPFHRIQKNCIFKGQDGEPIIFRPGTPSKDKGKKIVRGKDYWNNGDEFYVKLRGDEYWCMGDNRLGSSDSRVFGPIKRRLIHAKILYRIWSVDSDESWWIWDLIKNPIDFFKRIRLNRFFQRVK